MLSGSWLYGTQTQSSDEDWRGVFQLPNTAFLGLSAPKTTFEAKPDQVYHEIGHYMRLLMKGNPNIVEMLFAPDDVVHERSPIWNLLVELREGFITSRMASAYRGWALQELANFESGRIKDNPKRLSHIPRLVYELSDAVKYRFMQPRLTGRRLEFVMDVKEGLYGVDAVRIEVDEVIEDMGRWELPEPDYDDAEELLIDFRETYGRR